MKKTEEKMRISKNNESDNNITKVETDKKKKYDRKVRANGSCKGRNLKRTSLRKEEKLVLSI